MRKHTHTNRCTPELPYVAPATATGGQRRINSKRRARARFWAEMQRLWAVTS